MATQLKVLLQRRHCQTYEVFCREWDKAVDELGDPPAVADREPPSRSQFQRWKAGDVKSLPHARHLRVLAVMFPGWTAEQLFEPMLEAEFSTASAADVDQVLSAVRVGLDVEPASPRTWRSTRAGDDGSAPLPPSLSELAGAQDDEMAHDIGRGLLALQASRRLSDADLQMLATLAGNVVEFSLETEIDIAKDGWSTVAMSRGLLNLTRTPVSRVPHELWFENTRDSKLSITPRFTGNHRVMIQRLHDSDRFAKFASQISPPIKPGGFAQIGFSTDGGQFVEDHYWRQSINRYTRHFTLTLRHALAPLLQCSAVEEATDGTETLITDQIVWDQNDSEVTITLARDFLSPGQAITLRWEVDHGSA